MNGLVRNIALVIVGLLFVAAVPRITQKRRGDGTNGR